MTTPAYKRSLLLMAAKHQYGLTGECDWARDPTYLYHKTAVIRELKEQIKASPENPAEWSFSVIFYLVLMEVCLDPSNIPVQTVPIWPPRLL